MATWAMLPGRPPRAALAVALALLACLALGGVLSNGFIAYDDPVYVTANAHVTNGLAPASIAWAFTTFDAANWHPLTWISHLLDVQLFGLEPGRHHLTSLLLHAANAALLFLLLARLTGALWRPAFAAALFAVHPLHVESVAWIAERKDVLSTLFWLLTTLAWVHWLERRSPARYALVCVLYALGLMAKPMLVTLPLTLLVLDAWPLRRLEPRRSCIAGALREKLPLFALAAASAAMTVVAQHAGGALRTVEDVPLTARLGNAVVAMATYLSKTAWPASLSVFYPFSMPGIAAVLGSALLLAAITVLALRGADRRPYVLAGWLWYLVTLLPVIGIVQVGSQAMADRYTYVPLIGIFVVLAWGLGELAERGAAARGLSIGAAAIALVALVPVTHAQVARWSSTTTLFEHALAVTPDNWVAHGVLGRALLDAGRDADAIAQLDEAVRLRPDNVENRVNLGLALTKAGRAADALPHFERALALRPSSTEARVDLAGALLALGRREEAIAQLEEALRLDPQSAAASANLERLRASPRSADALLSEGVALARAGRLDEAIARFGDAVRLDPNSAKAHNALGVALARAGRMPEAAEEFRRAVQLDPSYDEAVSNLKRALRK